MSRLAVWGSPVWNYKLLENERKATVPNRRIYRFTGKSGEVHSLKVCQLVIAIEMARAKVLGVFVFGLQRSFLVHFGLQKESGKNRQTLKALGPASCLIRIGWSGFASFKRRSWSSEIMIFRFHVKLQCVPKTKFLSCILDFPFKNFGLSHPYHIIISSYFNLVDMTYFFTWNSMFSFARFIGETPVQKLRLRSDSLLIL